MKDDPILPGGWHRSATEANGDMHEWQEYEAECERDPREFQGAGDPDPRYDLAQMMDRDYRTFLKLKRLEDWLREHIDTQ